uniref:Uncharacterized protein n=1 Tax=Rhodnius prolixus TaxID=13249 RepID=T1I384_RHOPR
MADFLLATSLTQILASFYKFFVALSTGVKHNVLFLLLNDLCIFKKRYDTSLLKGKRHYMGINFFTMEMKVLVMELQENKQQEGPLVSGGGQDLVNVLLSKLDSISLDVNSIKTDMASMKVEHTNLIATVNSIKVDLTNKFEIVNKKLKENSTQILLLKKEKNAMKKELENTYSLINENLQSTQYNFIRILNVPVSENDNPMLAVKKISETINFVFNADKIDFCYRRKSRNNYSAPIFLKFLSDKDKNSFLKQKQLNKPKLTTNLFNDGNSRPIYISEYMSPFNNALFKKGKE